MTQAEEDKLEEKRSLYCYDCAEERIFVWTTWDGVAYYGYPALAEFGWECTMCGNRIRVNETQPDLGETVPSEEEAARKA
jgi:hypothetical protein